MSNSIEPMPEELFWAIVEPVAAIESDDVETQEEVMENQLRALNDAELMSFHLRYQRLHVAAYRWDLWEIAYFTGGGCSDDSFAYFRNWLIGRGREAYQQILDDPSHLVEHPMGEDPALVVQSVEWDLMPGQVWEERDDSRDDQAWWDIVSEHEPAAPQDPAGSPFDEDDIDGFRRRYPRLAEMYAHNLG